MTNQSTEWNAATYHKVANPHVGWGRRVLARLPLRGDETVIDAGCGTGRLTVELLERLPTGHVIAIDGSANMLQEAAAHLRPRFGDRVSFVQADLQHLRVAAPVDAIFSTATFHWIADHAGLFRRLIAALKPGGVLVAQCGGGPNIAGLMAEVNRLQHDPVFAPYYRDWREFWEFASATTTAERLVAAGFVNVATSLEEAPTTLAGAPEYHEFLETVVLRLHLEPLPSTALRTAFLNRLTEVSAASDAPFFLDYWRLNLSGQRPERGEP
ncbi:MAG: methyltransferase domain-containing protein [Chloroflexota bacterium]|nr:methyltransferase domain-containing protein [Chloroflexota bacterium]